MTRFLLVRHAAHDRLGLFLDGRRPGAALSDTGRMQAEAVANSLASQRIDALLTSPTERAAETAKIIGRHVGVAVEVEPGFDEIDFGDWSGCRFADLETRDDWRRWNEARSLAATPSGDTMRASQSRFLDALDTRRKAGPDATIVVVSHADPIKAAIAYHLGLPLDRLGRFEVSPASVTTVDVHAWGATLVALNERIGMDANEAGADRTRGTPA